MNFEKKNIRQFSNIWKKLRQKSSTKIAFSLIFILLIFLIEIFGFNGWYFKLPTINRGSHSVNINNELSINGKTGLNSLILHSEENFQFDNTYPYIARLSFFRKADDLNHDIIL